MCGAHTGRPAPGEGEGCLLPPLTRAPSPRGTSPRPAALRLCSRSHQSGPRGEPWELREGHDPGHPTPPPPRGHQVSTGRSARVPRTWCLGVTPGRKCALCPLGELPASVRTDTGGSCSPPGALKKRVCLLPSTDARLRLKRPPSRLLRDSKRGTLTNKFLRHRALTFGDVTCESVQHERPLRSHLAQVLRHLAVVGFFLNHWR